MREAQGLVQAYAGRTVLDVDHLRLEPGTRLAVVGPNGAGKSTLLRLLAFLERPVAGLLTLEGRAVESARQRRLARRKVTMVEQRPFLFRGTVLENVAWGERARGASQGDAVRSALDALNLLQAKTLAARNAQGLSEGEIQRVAVARALATSPDVLLLDEPVAGADRAAQHALYTAIATTQGRRSMAVCVASHQLEDAYRWADRILALLGGVPTPVTPENLFRVELPPGESHAGLKHVCVGSIEVAAATDKTGPAILAVPPTDIFVSREPLAASARNVFSGRVTRLSHPRPGVVHVAADVGVELVAVITEEAVRDLGLVPGGPVVFSFKASAVRVF